ncbi:hypothetical protein [Streptomyces sp. NPDC001100]
MPNRQRTQLGFALALPSFICFNIALAHGTNVWGWLALGVGVALATTAQKLLDPFWESRSHKAKRRRSAISGFAYPIVVFMMMVFQVPIAAREGHGAWGLPLIAAWLLYTLFNPSHEPEEFPLELLRLRIARATALRVAFNWFGMIGLIGFLANTATEKGLDGPALSISLTLFVGVTVSSLRIYSRVRKLCTRIHADTQRLFRDLEELREASDIKEQSARRATARRTWDDLHRVLRNRVDTGFHRYGTFVLPLAALNELQEKVVSAIDATPPTEVAHKALLDDLGTIKAACEAKLDDMT